MSKTAFETAKVYTLAGSIEYAPGSVVSKQVIKKKTGNATLFAFDEGESLSEHTAPFDALLQVLDGNAEITIAQQQYSVVAGECIVLPANVPHAVRAVKQFKMLLTMIRE